MRVAHMILALGIGLVLVVVTLLVRTPTLETAPVATLQPLPAAESGPLPPILTPEDGTPARRVYDISLHDAADLHLLLGRLEALANAPRPPDQLPEIALVLHGPELHLFAIRNYAANQPLVDLAAKLDAFQVIEIKACRSKMRSLDLRPEDMPAFIEIVPFGPDEVQRLEAEGYLIM